MKAADRLVVCCGNCGADVPLPTGPTGGVARKYLDGVPHGTDYAYRAHKCRCDDCKAANNQAQREGNRSRAAKLADDPSLQPHGNTATYSNWGCRCDDCRAAWSAEMAVQFASRKARLAADPTIVPHGRPSTYNGWGCRCDDCTRVYVAAQRRRDKARKERLGDAGASSVPTAEVGQ
jgi:hypothetical protein